MSDKTLWLGRFDYCLNVKDITQSHDFYSRLGFHKVEGDTVEKWMVLAQDGCRLALYEGHIPTNILNFRGADVFAVWAELDKRGIKFSTPAHVESDNSVGAVCEDPDGNVIYLNTHPDEKIKPPKS